MPPSMSSNNNKTLLIGCEDISQNNKELLELGYSIGNKLKENCELNILNFKGEQSQLYWEFYFLNIILININLTIKMWLK